MPSAQRGDGIAVEGEWHLVALGLYAGDDMATGKHGVME